ncbi:MAG: sigma-54-dependent Fis family transcriptional regulator [Spirochaetes bacterium]|nr:sigma-54-dependent Fis family transcriptional regulator [Spirochaetota bacterium]
MNKINILIIDDEEYIRKIIKRSINKIIYKVYEASRPSQAFKILDKNSIDLVILDYKLPEMDGIKTLEKIKKDFSKVEVIMISAYENQGTLIKAMELGAFDFFHKPIKMLELKIGIERTTRYINLQDKFKNIENKYMLISNELRENTGNIIGNSKAIKSVLELTYKAANSDDTSILITGESGTGKELIAKAIHYLSSRRETLFYSLNCSAITESLIESLLFGHVKGAFTGASDDKKGCFEAANGGTLFLDEIGDMPLDAQSKLLRVLEEKKIKKIGSNKDISVDVRIISATNRNISQMVEEKKFRLDLYYRLNTLEINMPSLRERKEDIPLLINYYIDHYSKKLKKDINNIDKNFIETLYNYDFPGNIRELKNIIERSIIISDENELKLERLNFKKKDNNYISYGKAELFETLKLDEIEKKAIKIALEKTYNNKSHASKILNISRQALDRKINKYKL